MAGEELLDRQTELAVIEARLAGAVAGGGGLLVIEGPAGIGKTALLRAAIDRARSADARILSAWAAPLEQDLAFGVARAVFQPTQSEMTAGEWEALSQGAAGLASAVLDDTGRDWPDSAMAAAHGLYWLTANLAADRPVVITVDDLQWADPGSLRWLAYTARRLDGLPVLVVATVRIGESGSRSPLLAEVAGASGSEPLRPAPLGEAAAKALVRRDLTGATAEFCRACHAATGGNPFLLRSLAGSLRAEGVEPNDEAALQVAEFGPESVAVALDRRLAALPTGAGPFLEAVAILGSDGTLRHCAGLAGIDLETAAALADALIGVGVLVPPDLRFVHPVVRAAVNRRIGIGARGVAHGRAARLLAADGVLPDRLAPHLLQTHPSGDPWVVSTLRAAAKIAIDRGTPETAETYLRRAIDEPPAPADRPFVLVELGIALSARRDPEAPTLFRTALTEMGDIPERGDIALVAARNCNLAVRTHDAVAICRLALERATSLDAATHWSIEAEMLAGAWFDGSTAHLTWEWVERDRSHLDTGTSADVLVAVIRAQAITWRSGPANDALALAHDVLVAGLDAPTFWVLLTLLLIHNDELDIADRLASENYRLGQELASPTVLANYGYLRGLTRSLRGALAQAEPDLRSCYEINCELDTDLGAAWALGQLLDVLCAAGDLEAAEAELSACRFDVPDKPYWGTALLLENRAGLRSAQGRHEEALKDYEAAASVWAAIGTTNPNITRWRAGAARTLAHLGRHDDAHKLASENFDLAQATGLPRAIGVALHTLGVVEDNPVHFEAAIATLRTAPAPLELTRSLIAYGAALRRDGQRSAAQEPLREALELAHRCGAKGLAEQARDELRIAGGRPRRATRSGVESLTPQERRVADLAADGLSNREIAERLFVSERTVETHLHHVFQKLTVTTRTALATLLENPSGDPT
jgi:DNA-binding CsgD family transcriptional regulator